MTVNEPVVLKALASAGDDSLHAILDWARDSVLYVDDKMVHSVDDYWQAASETVSRRTGDCEDKAILAVSMLRTKGIPAEDVLVVLGHVRVGSLIQGHSWLLVRESGTWAAYEPTANTWKVAGLMKGNLIFGLGAIALGILEPPLLLAFPFALLLGEKLGETVGDITSRMVKGDLIPSDYEVVAFNDQYVLERGAACLRFLGWHPEGAVRGKPVEARFRIENKGEYPVVSWIRTKVYKDIVTFRDPVVYEKFERFAVPAQGEHEFVVTFTPDQATSASVLPGSLRSYYFEVEHGLDRWHPKDSDLWKSWPKLHVVEVAGGIASPAPGA